MKRITFLMSIVTVLFLASCQETDDSMPETFSDVEEIEVESEAAVSSSLEDVDVVTEAGMEFINASGRSFRDRILDCADVEVDTVNKVVTVDFGDGCEGPHGTVRSGKIIIEYNERHYVPSSYRIVTFENFFVDSIQVEGVRTVTNITDPENDTAALTFEITMVGGKLTFPDGTTITRDAEHTRTWYRTSDRESSYATLEGGAEGQRRDGSDYTVTILERLVFKRDCHRGRIFVPVSGIKEIVTGDKTILVDYGDGACDNLAEITVNGETFTVQIHPRGRRRW